MSVSERIAYLKGLVEGLGISAEDSNEAKVIMAIIDTLEEISLNIEDIEENALDLGEEIDAISEDLADVEDVIYGEDDEEDEDEDYDYDDEDYMYSVKCPTCDNEITVDEGVIDKGSINCPNCGELLEFEVEDEDEDSESDDGEEE